MINFICLFICIFSSCFLYSWEEDPRREEHLKLTDKLIKLGNKQIEEKNEDVIKFLKIMSEERNKIEESNNE